MCLNDDIGLTSPYFTANSNVESNVFILGKLLKIFNG